MLKKAFEINDIYTAVKSANIGIEIVVSFESEGDQAYNHNVITSIKNVLERNNLRLNCRLGISTKGDIDKNKGVLSILASLNKSGWEVRKFDSNAINFISVDEGKDFFIWEIKGNSVNVFDPGLDQYGRRHLFSHMWELVGDLPITKKESELNFLYEDLLLPSLPKIQKKIIQISHDTWDEIIIQLSRNPIELFSLKPRKFEELIAELLFREGFDIKLTPETRDGGRDILAFNKSTIGKHLYLVECKKYSPQIPVGVSLVRALYGCVEQERATAGMIVTTSYFSKDALDFREPLKYRLKLKDYEELVRWLTGRTAL